MPDPNSPSWNDRFEYHLGQALIAAGGTLTVNPTNTPSWHFRVETILKDIATALQNGGGGGSGDAISIHGNPLDEPTLNRSVPIFNSATARFNMIPIPANLVVTSDIGQTIQPYDTDLVALASLGNGIPRRNSEGNWTALDPNSLGGSGTPQQSNNSYYTYLQSLSGLRVLVGLEDWDGNIVFDRNNTQIGYYSGNFAQQRPSLLTDTNAKSTLFRTGAALIDGAPQINSDISSATVVCRFRARADATGVLFSYGNTTDFNPSAYDRVVYLNGDTLSFYGFDAVNVQAVNLDSVLNVRDNLPHTLVARISPAGTDIWVDNTKIIDDPRQLKSDYNGFWRIGHGLIFGPRSSFGGFARGINIAGFATYNRTLLELTELPGIHTNA